MFDLSPFEPQNSTQEVYRAWRERFVMPLLIGVLIFGAIALLPALNTSNSMVIDGIFITAYLVVGIVAVFKFSYNTRIIAFLISAFVLALGELISLGILGDSIFFFLGFVTLATMLHSPKAGFYSLAASIITIFIVGWFMLNDRIDPLFPSAPAMLEDWISAGAALTMFSVVIITGFTQLEKAFSGVQNQINTTLNDLREERNNLENRVQERTLQLRRINEVERAVAAILEINDILPMAAKFVQHEFSFYFTAVYLLDPSAQWAELREAVGEMGLVMKEKKHRIHIGSKNVVAQVIRSKSGLIIEDQNQISSENPMFPYTRSLIVVPLVVGDTILGALEMHSEKEHNFLPQDLDAYQNMANGISSAIENARLYQEAQQSISEMRATQRQYLEAAWNTLVSERSLEYSIGETDPSEKNLLEVPLALRNQTLGKIVTTGSNEWSNEQRNLIDAISAQATLALENARLVESSQVTASQERLTNEIIAKIWGASSMDGILQTAVREIGRNLEAAEVEIEISMDEAHDE